MPEVTVDCSAIPRKMYRSRVCYDWERAVDTVIPFRYGELSGEMSIADVGKRGHEYMVALRCGDKTTWILSSSLLGGHIGACVGGRTLEYRFFEGQVLRDDKRDLTILKVYKGKIPGYSYEFKMLTYQCNVCGHIGENVREGRITRGGGCPVCNGKIVKPGYNDIPTTEPWMVSYFPKGAAQARGYTASSGRRLRLKCPHCGRLSDHPTTIATLYRTHSIGCPCGDGVSLPEKFVFCFFRAMGVTDYTRQVSSKDFQWCGRYRYDGMFRKDGQIYFVEIHGPQHYMHTGYETISSISLEENQANDRCKKALALENGIQESNYIVLDCRESTLRRMREAIFGSELAAVLGLNGREVDWDAIYMEALAPLPKSILDCALQNPDMSTTDIARRFGVHRGYPVKVLMAYGTYGKEERARRKSKKCYEKNRTKLFAEIEKLIACDPNLTVAQIAEALGRSRTGIYALLREHEHNIDVDRLSRNAEKVRLDRCRERVGKAGNVTAPDGAGYQFENLTAACRELGEKYGVHLVVSGASIAISKERAYKGFVFRYEDTV